MKVTYKGDALRIGCGAIFALFALLSIRSVPAWLGIIFSDGGTQHVVSITTSFITIVRNILLAIACIKENRKLGAIGFGVSLIGQIIFTITASSSHAILLIKNVLGAVMPVVGIKACLTQGRSAKTYGFIMAGICVFSIVLSYVASMLLPGYSTHLTWQTIAYLVVYSLIGFVFNTRSYPQLMEPIN